MSGHSKWATTKHKKAIVDAKRGKLFAKLIKNIEIAAKMGGPDPSGNPTLYAAIQKAKKQSVPNKNIDSAVKRGGGLDGGGVNYETIMYEVYGPQGVALLVECLTDNRNRAAMEVRTAVTRNGGTMADPGSVSRLFTRKGVVVVGKSQERGGKPWEVTEDDVLEATLDAGAEDVTDLGDSFEVQSESGDVVAVRTALLRRCRQRASTTTRPRCSSWRPWTSRSARSRWRARCSGSWMPSTTSTTCRTSTATRTSPTTCWSPSTRERGRASGPADGGRASRDRRVETR
jgi:YebC/PmpR family DNA-binding regulatory protein